MAGPLALLGGVAKGAVALGVLGKKSKVDPAKFAGKMDGGGGDKGGDGGSKGGPLAVQPSTSIIKVVDIKVESGPEIKVDSKDPVQGEAHKVYNQVIDIEKALGRESKAKRKRAKKQVAKTKKRQRIAKENWLEKGAKKIGAAAGSVASKVGVTSLWQTILEIIGVTFLGWMTKFLPQILGFAKFVIEWVSKIANFVGMLLKPIVVGIMWIAGAGAALLNTLMGTDPEEAAQKSLLGNLADLQKKIPLVEAAFAAFLVLGGRGKIKKFRKPSQLPKKSPKIKTPADRKAEARNRLQNQKANKNLKKINDFRKNQTKKITNAVSKEVPPGVKKVASNVGNTAKNVTSKVGKLGGKLMKGLKMVGKFAKFPVIGPIIIAVTQLLAGEPIGKALFMGLGASLGGALGGVLAGALAATGIGSVLSPIALILGEGVGAFVGELLYEATMGAGIGAAMKRFGEVVGGIFKGVGNALGAIVKFIFGGGLIKFLLNVLGGIGKVIAWVLHPTKGLLSFLFKGAVGILKLAAWIFSPTGLIWEIIKLGGKGLKMIWDFLFGGGLWNLIKGAGSGILKVVKFLLIDAIPMALGAVGNAAAAVLSWLGSGIKNFIVNFPQIKFPDAGIGDMIAGFIEKIPFGDKILGLGVPFTDWNVRGALEKLPSIPEMLGGLFKMIGLEGLTKDGKVEGIPNLLLLTPLGIPFLLPHLFKSFFPPKGEGGNAVSGSSSGGASEPSKDGEKGDSKSDAIKPNEDAQKSASSTASSISSSASYDKKGGRGSGIVPLPIPDMKSGAAGGGGGAGGAVGVLNKYEYASAFQKTLALAKMYKE